MLDIGCGSGLPSTARLARTLRVVGVDISAEQIARARRNMPSAELIRADVLDLDLAEGSFDGVCALYSIAHIPRERHARLFARIRAWLRPGGVFVAALGVGDLAGWTGEWLGVPMFFSSHSEAENRRLLAAAGLEPVTAQVVTIHEPEGDVAFHWVVCEAV